MASIPLTGFDGSNPLAFLAALGVLQAACESSVEVTLRWADRGTWQPDIAGFADLEALIECLEADRVACAADPALALEYDGKRDLKPAPAIYRAYLEALARECQPSQRRSVDWATAFATDVSLDRSGKIKPTALHFTAGQQQFLLMVGELVRGVSKDDLAEAVVGPWQYERPLPVMGWDATVSRAYALRASDPSTDKKLGVPGADWLAIRGLAMLPSFPRGRQIMTTGCSGRWKHGHFRWPLWTMPLTAPVVRTLLGQPLEAMDRQAREAMGIGAVLVAGIARHPQGGRGSFTPSSVG